MKRSWLRGHPIIWKKGKWIYEDDGADIPANGGKTRPCIKCGKLFKDTQVDPCLGILPGVDNACCGHGVRERSYIRFTNGVVITEFKIEKGINNELD